MAIASTTLRKRFIDRALLQTAAEAVGISHVGVLGEVELDAIFHSDGPALQRWQDAGYAGEMRYMQRSAELLARPRALDAGLRSVVSFAIPYLTGSPRPPEQIASGHGRVARYAWGRDYHRVLKRTLKRFIAEVLLLRPDLAPISYRVFSDAVPLLERALATRAGLGIIGKNTMLIRPGEGSYFFLAEILWDVEVAPTPDSKGVPTVAEPCGSCQRCLRNCPTDAFSEARVLDARRCISYLTIEKRGAFDDWEAAALGGWVFGCDVCQEVCPFNHEAIPRSAVKEFDPVRGEGGVLAIDGLLQISSAEEFLERFAGTAIMRGGWRRMVRNAAAVAGNTIHLPSIPQLLPLLHSGHPEVANEARRALMKLEPYADGSERRRIGSRLADETSE